LLAVAACGASTLATWSGGDATFSLSSQTTVTLSGTISSKDNCSLTLEVKSDAGTTDDVDFTQGSTTSKTLVLGPGNWTVGRKSTVSSFEGQPIDICNTPDSSDTVVISE
jgi:hypothetical protein